VAVLSRHAETVAGTWGFSSDQLVGIACDVLDRATIERAAEQVKTQLGAVDILINAAGGNHPPAITSAERFFDLERQGASRVFDVNFVGTFQTCQVFGRDMAGRGQGCIASTASMSSLRPLTRVPAYSAAKAAVVNVTQ
jgi:NAD(P)-dependent dehydrogenase (short-subunit alcohol dehydrogenase family)